MGFLWSIVALIGLINTTVAWIPTRLRVSIQRSSNLRMLNSPKTTSEDLIVGLNKYRLANLNQLVINTMNFLIY